MSDELVRRIAKEIADAETAYSVPAPRWREVAAERIHALYAERIEALEAQVQGESEAAKAYARQISHLDRALVAIEEAHAAEVEALEAERDALGGINEDFAKSLDNCETALAAEREKVARLVEVLRPFNMEIPDDLNDSDVGTFAISAVCIRRARAELASVEAPPPA